MMNTRDITALIVERQESALRTAAEKALGREFAPEDAEHFNLVWQGGVQSLYYKGNKILSTEIVSEGCDINLSVKGWAKS